MSANPDPGHAPLDVVLSQAKSALVSFDESSTMKAKAQPEPKPKPIKWGITRRSDEDFQYILAADVMVKDGALVFSRTAFGFGVPSEIVQIVAPGTWRDVWPADEWEGE